MKEQVYDNMFKEEGTFWWFKAKREIILTLLGKYCHIAIQPQSIVDCGCGCGYLVKVLSNYPNLEVQALDFSETAVNYTKQNFKGKVQQADLAKPLPIANDSVDIAIMSDVLEHIDDHLAALENIQRILSLNGTLLLTVPAYKCLWSEHDIEHMHKRRYTRKELKTLLETTGYHVEFISYYNFWLFLPILLVRYTKKILKIKSADTEEVNGKLNELFYRIFTSEERHLVKGKSYPFGVSLVAIAKKR